MLTSGVEVVEAIQRVDRVGVSNSTWYYLSDQTPDEVTFIKCLTRM